MNDRPVACQTREPTDPQGDRWRVAPDEVLPPSFVPPAGDVPHIPAASAATYPLRCFAPQWARFDNRHSTSAPTPTLTAVSGSGARGTSSPLNRQRPPPHQFREVSTVKFAPAAPRKEVLKRSFKWRFWLLLSPKTKVTRARRRETLPRPAPADAIPPTGDKSHSPSPAKRPPTPTTLRIIRKKEHPAYSRRVFFSIYVLRPASPSPG